MKKVQTTLYMNDEDRVMLEVIGGKIKVLPLEVSFMDLHDLRDACESVIKDLYSAGWTLSDGPPSLSTVQTVQKPHF